MRDVYLGLGSNLGNRQEHLSDAEKLINQLIGEISDRSSLYETASWGKTDQPSFINQVLRLRSEKSAHEVLEIALKIEKKLGRERREKWGPRIIDIDLLFFGGEIIDEPGLLVPHPYIPQRAFVLIPLSEIAPYYEHPQLKMTISQLCDNLEDASSVRKVIF